MTRPTLAVIGTFHKRYEESRTAIHAVLASSRRPDQFFVLCEDEGDERNAREAIGDDPLPTVMMIPTERIDGAYVVVPFSKKINWALDVTTCDYIVYLDNASRPHPLKYELMMDLILQFGYGAVYCTQERTGFMNHVAYARDVVTAPFCVLNFTQVMHKKTDARWSLNMSDALPNDLVDAYFFRSLVPAVGAFYPVETSFPLDYHHIPSPAPNI